MISGVTADVSCVFKVAKATLTPTIAVPPRLGVPGARATPTPPAARRPADAASERSTGRRRKTDRVMTVLLEWSVRDVCPSRPPWPAGVDGRYADRGPAWRQT